MAKIDIVPGKNGFTEIISDKALSGKTIVTKGTYTLLTPLKNREEEN